MVFVVRLVHTVCGALALVVSAATAQRTHQRHSFDDPEGRLIAYYSSTLLYTPVGAPLVSRAWSVDVGVEATYIPPLSESKRTAFLDKPEATNLAPLLPRPRIALNLPGNLAAQVSWVPPIRVFDVEANLWSVSVARPVGLGRLSLVPRLVASGGRVRGSITCFPDLARGDQGRSDYYTHICNARESDDHFEPQHLAGDVALARGPMRVPVIRAIVPYLGAGVLRETTTFDIGVIRPDGSRDTDHPILELRATRPYGFAGGTWLPEAGGRFSRLRLSAELFYAPGSVFTIRTYAGLHLREATDAR